MDSYDKVCESMAGTISLNIEERITELQIDSGKNYWRLLWTNLGHETIGRPCEWQLPSGGSDGTSFALLRSNFDDLGALAGHFIMTRESIAGCGVTVPWEKHDIPESAQGMIR